MHSALRHSIKQDLFVDYCLQKVPVSKIRKCAIEIIKPNSTKLDEIK
jgi:hypothetical protein